MITFEDWYMRHMNDRVRVFGENGCEIFFTASDHKSISDDKFSTQRG